MTRATVRRTPAPAEGVRRIGRALISAVIMACAVFALGVGSARADTDPMARGLAAAALKSASFPTILVAASNAPAAVKARAQYVCTGTNDDVCIQTAISSLQNAPTVTRSGTTLTSGKMGAIRLSEGQFNLSTAVSIPAGSVLSLYGSGVSSWIAIDALNNHYEGGTILYSTDPTGAALAYPLFSARPYTEVDLRDLEIRVFNPAANVAGVALNLDGMISGVVSNINVLADLSTNSTQHISQGFSLQAGGSSARKLLMGINVYNFRQTGFNVNTTHVTGLNISVGNIANDAFSTGFSISGDNDQFWAGLQVFGASFGLKSQSGSNTALDIASLHVESSANPVTAGSARPIYIRRIELDTGVNWTGDLADRTKVVVDAVLKTSSPNARSQYAGTATMTSGTTTVVVTHNLFTTPTEVLVTPQGNLGACWVPQANIGATTFTINCATAPGADTTIAWRARV